MLLISVMSETAGTGISAAALIAAGIAFAVFLILGVVTWSYRDVYHRHNDKVAANSGAHDSDSAGH